KWRRPKADAALINDDLVFEIELLKQVDINIDYILMLVKKYHDTNCADKVIVADIMRAVSSSYELRNKKDLIEQFVDSINSSTDVDADWRKYIAEQSSRELAAIVAEERLDNEACRKYLARAFRDGDITDTGTAIIDLMLDKPSRFAPEGEYAARKFSIFERLKAFFERFSGVGLEFE
ncbi:MAG: hypothetical protein IJ131_07890, partial [Eggerthellaceae bacterium]|nr:hypothetical protein [Eggerthellaceae bacterium]